MLNLEKVLSRVVAFLEEREGTEQNGANLMCCFYLRTVKDVKAAFKKYDRNADGSISKGELNHALTNYKFNFSDQVKSIYI